MSIANIVCKLSSFANYTDLNYDKDDVIKILGAFDDPSLAPSVVSEFRADGVVKQRMHFTAQNGLSFFQINSDRIDIQMTSNEKSGFSVDKLPEVRCYLCETLEKLYGVFSDRAPIPYRLAWNTSYVYFEITSEQKDEYRNKFLRELDFFKDNRLDDTIIRYAGRREALIRKATEKLNVLATINSFLAEPGTENAIDGFKIDYDINTWQGNRRNRFCIESFAEFIEKAVIIEGELNKELLP